MEIKNKFQIIICKHHLLDVSISPIYPTEALLDVKSSVLEKSYAIRSN